MWLVIDYAKHVIINRYFVLNRTHPTPPHQVKRVITLVRDTYQCICPFLNDFNDPPLWSSNGLLNLKFLQRERERLIQYL
jgi:hypothetical protein